MKKWLAALSLALSGVLLFGTMGCAGDGPAEEPPKDDDSSVEQPGEETPGVGNDDQEDGVGGDDFTPRARQEMPTVEIVDTEYDYGDDSAWGGVAYSSLDLGSVYLQDVIDDNVYDWGHSVLKEDGVYKMWWVRPAVYDAIFYAESTDLKNWSNVQRVICLSPNSTNVTKYENIKGMLGKPSVVHVGDTYYMYFEAPASEDPDVTQTVLEWDNQVMLATSSDGINWEFYSDESGQPRPVVAMPEELMGNFTSKEYGAGQPSVFYKDETFYLTYCYVIYSQGIHEIRVATSKDGKNFGDISTHTRISDGNGLGVTYNVKTGKYMMCSPSAVLESETLSFTDQDMATDGNVFYTYDSTTIQTSFAEFVRNAHGLVDTETFYVIHLQGARSTTSDWRAEHTTWDGHIHAVNPKEYANRTITLPNGAAATTANAAGYRDRSNSYSRPTADAIYAEDSQIRIDAERDEVYEKATKIVVSRPVYAYGSNLTEAWAEAWVAWNEGYLYVYARVYDNTPDNSYPILGSEYSYMHDGFDVFVDVPNDHGAMTNVAYGIEQYMICTDSNNTDFIIKGSDEYDLTDEFSGIRHRVKRTSYGYAVEWRVAWHMLVEDDIAENKYIGMDFQVNDAMGHGVGREAMVVWSDHTGEAFRYVENLGDVYLVKA